ncbi:MAG: tRNA (N(6)-L-threonylcarbamoyladenosine(37)-C(2))-methylthiotransferase [Candidatus Aenigmatarchaeota archaeon]
MNIYIETYGCSNNIAESQIMAGLLTRSGFSVINDIENADIIIVNTCSVKSTTEQKILYRIKHLREKYPKKKMIITGCMPESEYDIVKSFVPNASFVGTHHITYIAKAVKSEMENKHIELLGKIKKEKLCLPKIRENNAIDIVPISSGCSSYCSYCSTKLAKGDLFSYSGEKIIEEIKIAKSDGCKEFWLTSQDCGCYGLDKNTNITELLKNIIKNVSGKYFLRIGMMNPQNIMKFIPELIDVFKDEHVFKFIHLPVQSGSDKILKLMNRGYTINDFKHIINEFRKEIPEITLWTDIIVGFPSEDEEDFNKSVELIKEIKPDFVNISTFGPRPGTKAAKMKQILTNIKKERTRILTKIVDKISLEKNKKWVGWKGEVIIDEYKKERKNFIARNFAYKPIVLHGNFKIGDFVNAKIISASKTYLVGEVY